MSESPEERGFNARLAQFSEMLSKFRATLEALKTPQAVEAAESSPQLERERQRLLDQAEWIEGTIGRAQDAILWVRQQLDNAAATLNGHSNLGAVPFVAWGVAAAALTGAIGAMTLWLSSAQEWAARAKVAEAIQAAGGSPAEIRAALPGANGFSSLLTLAALGIGIYWLSSNGKA